MSDSGERLSIPAERDSLTYEELRRAMHLLIDAEHEAHRLYARITRIVDKTLALELLKDAADEEKFYTENVKRTTGNNYSSDRR